MTAWTITKLGKAHAGATGNDWYYPVIIDTSTVPNWPYSVTVFSSADHGPNDSSIHMGGAVGDPTVTGNWEDYNTSKAAGRFDAWATATGETLPAANPVVPRFGLDQVETPGIQRIGDYWYLSMHDKVAAGTASQDQPTRMLRSTANGPLNFTLLDNGNGGKIIGGLTSPGTTWPEGPGESGHRGYMRWGPNKFAGFVNPGTGLPYNYVGYAYNGGLLESPIIMAGSDDALTWAHAKQIGPHSGYTPVWSAITAGSALDDYRVSPRYHELDAGSISDEVAGEHWFLTSGALSAGVSGTHEGCLATDGYTETRARRLVMGLGGSGADDSNGIGPPCAIPYGGSYFLVYRGRNASSVNSLMLATATFNPNAEKHAPIVVPNHDKYIFDARGASALPDWLTVTNGAAPTFDANGYTTPATENPDGPLYRGVGFNPAAAGWAEMYVEEQAGNSGSTGGCYIGFIDAETGTTSTDSIWGQTLSSAKPLSLRYKVNPEATVVLANTAWVWRDQVGDAAGGNGRPSQEGRRHAHGIRWYVPERKVLWLIGGRNRAGNLETKQDVTALAQITTTMYPFVRSFANAHKVARIEMRVGNASGNARPSVASAEATATNKVLFTFDKAVIGDGTGFVVKDGVDTITGTFTRPSTTTLEFTRTTGTWTGALTYDITNSDIRS